MSSHTGFSPAVLRDSMRNWWVAVTNKPCCTICCFWLLTTSPLSCKAKAKPGFHLFINGLSNCSLTPCAAQRNNCCLENHKILIVKLMDNQRFGLRHCANSTWCTPLAGWLNKPKADWLHLRYNGWHESNQANSSTCSKQPKGNFRLRCITTAVTFHLDRAKQSFNWVMPSVRSKREVTHNFQ